MTIILSDLDNTISNMDRRLHYLNRDDPDWDAFEAECDKDPPIISTITILTALYEKGSAVWIWTGRSDAVKDKTVRWLKLHGVPYDQLIMRPHGDQTSTTLLKKLWLNDCPVPKHRVLCAFDDDPRIIKMLGEEGIPSYQVRK